MKKGKGKEGKQTSVEICRSFFNDATEAHLALKRKGPFRSSKGLEEVKDLYLTALEKGMNLCRQEADGDSKAEIEVILKEGFGLAEELKIEIDRLSSLSSLSSSSSSFQGKKLDNHNYYEPPTIAQGNTGGYFTLPPSQRPKPSPNVVPSSSSTPSQTATPGSVPRGDDGAIGGGGIGFTPSVNKDRKLNEFETQLMGDILDGSPEVKWDDIAGLVMAKQTMQETVILPNLRPDIFTGLRAPPKGVLLYGPPGTGKTLLAKAVATESGFTFFNITSSSVTGKYVGEGEKLMKTLMSMARAKQPTVLFFDEIDALMSARKDGEHEASRRLKTQFMVEVDGAATTSEDRILVIGATNVPWDLDEAVLRRMSKRIYVPLPDREARKGLITNLFLKHTNATKSGSIISSITNFLFSGKGTWSMSSEEFDELLDRTEGYSGSDLSAVCKEAAMGPVRELSSEALRTVKAEDMRQMNFQDFVMALNRIRPSVSSESLNAFAKWDNAQNLE